MAAMSVALGHRLPDGLADLPLAVAADPADRRGERRQAREHVPGERPRNRVSSDEDDIGVGSLRVGEDCVKRLDVPVDDVQRHDLHGALL